MKNGQKLLPLLSDISLYLSLYQSSTNFTRPYGLGDKTFFFMNVFLSPKKWVSNIKYFFRLLHDALGIVPPD